MLRPVSSERLPALAMNCRARSSSAAGSPAAVSWIQNSKPPVVPMPGIAGGAIGTTRPSRIPRVSFATFISTALAFSSRAFLTEE